MNDYIYAHDFNYENGETNKDKLLNTAIIYKFINLEKYLIYYYNDNKHIFILVENDNIITLKTEKYETYRDGGTTFAEISGYDNKLVSFYKPSSFNKDPLKKITFDKMVLEVVKDEKIIDNIKTKIYNIV